MRVIFGFSFSLFFPLSLLSVTNGLKNLCVAEILRKTQRFNPKEYFTSVALAPSRDEDLFGKNP